MDVLSIKFINQLIKFGILSVFCLCMGCQPAPRLYLDDVPPLPTHVDNASERTVLYLQKKFNQQGIRVISMGQNYMISIPAAVLFQDQSPALTWASYALLNDVACYLQQFRKISVHVNVFSSCYLSRHREKALTLMRARAVGDYLWSQGIDSRFIFTRGFGSDKPIVEHAKALDTSPNSRIEITFRRAII